MSQDLTVRMLSDLHSKVDKLTDDISDLKSSFQDNVTDLKVAQSKCDSRWSILSKTFFGGLGLTGLGTWLASLFPPHSN